MASLQMRLVAAFLRLTSKSSMATPERAQKRIAAPKGTATPPSSLRQRCRVSSREVAGFTCYTVAPREGQATRAAIYLHGGSYISEIVAQHWALIARLAAAGVRVEVPIYGLAPQYSYREAYPFVTSVYHELLADVEPSAITIAGDSAGGGFALGFAQTLASAGLPQPRQLLLIAPWLDITMRNPAIPPVEARDPWLTSVGSIATGRAWAAGDDPTDPRLSPINGSLAGLAPMLVYIGTRDLLYPDVLRLQQLAQAAGASVSVTVCEGAVHDYPLVPAPEGRAAARTIISQIAR